MAYFKQSQVVLGSFLLAAVMTGCVPAHPAPRPVAVAPMPRPAPPPPQPQPKLAKVVVLPLDKAALPEKAEEINAKLALVMLPGAEAPTLTTISMETAQLQAECADATEACYLKIAGLVEADRLLWAQVENGGAKANKKKKGKPSFKLQIMLFDRDKLAVAGKAEETFTGVVTDEDLDKLITAATGVTPGAHAAPAPTPAADPTAAQMPQAHPAAAPATATPAYTAQPTGQAAAPAPTTAGQPVYQQQPGAAQPNYYGQPSAAPAPAAYPRSQAPAAGYQAAPGYQTAPAAYPPASSPAPAAYPPAATPPAAAPPAARHQ